MSEPIPEPIQTGPREIHPFQKNTTNDPGDFRVKTFVNNPSYDPPADVAADIEESLGVDPTMPPTGQIQNPTEDVPEGVSALEEIAEIDWHSSLPDEKNGNETPPAPALVPDPATTIQTLSSPKEVQKPIKPRSSSAPSAPSVPSVKTTPTEQTHDMASGRVA